MTTTHTPEWRIISQSVRGASHIRAGLPNQDAVAFSPESGVGPPLILALSDGHGSSKSFRSDLGSAFAVEGAVQLVQELVGLMGQTPKTLSAVKRTAEERLPQELVRRWQAAVDAHLQDHPFTEEEMARLARDRGEQACREVLAHPRLAYGATLLAVLATDEFLLFLQLGDGDILLVSETGEVTHALSRDPRLIANETTSLCTERAWREVRLRFHARYGDLPALIVVSTDGYANSFVNEAAFLKVGSDLLEFLRTEGVASVEENLHIWLEEASEVGSGDDITLGILYRADIVSPRDEEPVGEAAAQPDDQPEPPDGSEPAPEQAPEPESRKMIARLKHDGPHEPAKQSRRADILPEDPGENPSRMNSEDDPAEAKPTSTD